MSDGWFEYDNGTNPKKDLFRRQMYAYLPSWHWIPGDLQNFVLGKLHRVVPIHYIARHDHWSAVVRAVLGVPLTKREMDPWRGDDGQYLTSGYMACNSLTQAELAEDAGSPLANLIDKLSAEASTQPRIQGDTYGALVETIKDLQAKDVRVVFYTPPYTEVYLEAMDPRRIARTHQTMRHLQQAYDIEYYDFSTDTRFVSNTQLFLDTHHLNLCGARLFSEHLKQQMAVNVAGHN